MHKSYSSMGEVISNEPIDDEYLYQLHAKLKLMKDQRKQYEKDNLLLNGRVQCLKNEHEKTLKKIELTKKKTKDRVFSIERKRSQTNEKIKLKKQREEDLKNLKIKNLNQKSQIEYGINFKREEKIRANQREAKLLKEQQKTNEELMKNLELEEQFQKKEKIDAIKSQHYLNEERKKAIEIAKKNEIKNDLENKLQLELRLKEENDIKIKQLTQLENEILNRIKDTTNMHRHLIEEFEKLFHGNNDSEDLTLSYSTKNYSNANNNNRTYSSKSSNKNFKIKF